MYTSFIYDNFKIKIQIKRFNYILLINNLIKKITHKLKLTKKKNTNNSKNYITTMSLT